MKDAVDYLAHIRALIIKNLRVMHWSVIREETQGDLGLFRYRLTLRDGSLLELFQRFEVLQSQVRVTKYSFHWQDTAGQLYKRWDSAAHHPEIPTHPHHVHDGEASVLPHEPMGVEQMLPNFEYFNLKGEAAHGVAIDPGTVGMVVAYGLAYTAVLLVIACLIFERRDVR